MRHTADAADSEFMNEAMADEFLRFLAAYIKAEKVKTEAIQDNFHYFGSTVDIFEEKGWKKYENFVVVAL